MEGTRSTLEESIHYLFVFALSNDHPSSGYCLLSTGMVYFLSYISQYLSYPQQKAYMPQIMITTASVLKPHPQNIRAERNTTPQIVLGSKELRVIRFIPRVSTTICNVPDIRWKIARISCRYSIPVINNGR
jgi:hypothetical protein